MKFAKGLALVGLAVASSAVAQEVTTEKKASIQSVLPGAYGSVQVRHYTDRQMDSQDKKVNETVNLQVRPTLGTTLFDGKVDSSFTWVFLKLPDSTKIEKAGLFNETYWKVLQSDKGYLGPYAYVEQAQGQEDIFATTWLGAYGEITQPIAIPSGELELYAVLNPTADFYSGKQGSKEKVTPSNNTGLDAYDLNADTEESDQDVERRDPILRNFSELSVKYKPAAAPAFSVATAVDYVQKWSPQYAASLVDGEPRTELDHYEFDSLVITKLALSYKLSSAVSLTNSLRHHTVGFYQEGLTVDNADKTDSIGPSRWENRVILSATLF